MSKALSDYTIVLIEPTDIVLEGLSQILKSLPCHSIIKCRSVMDFSRYASRSNLLLIVNPDMLRKDPRSELRLNGTAIIMAVSYSAFDESLRGVYDDIIFLHDDTETIREKIRKAVKNARKPEEDSQRTLSQREKEILAAVASGKTNKEIADEFCLSVNTVVTHRKNISAKLGINSIAGLTVYAVLHKLIDSEKNTVTTAEKERKYLHFSFRAITFAPR